MCGKDWEFVVVLVLLFACWLCSLQSFRSFSGALRTSALGLLVAFWFRGPYGALEGSRWVLQL